MKFTIEESNIESFNETHNQCKNFTDGLNVIFGENEIGKSTLMNFIKNILTKTSDAKGYIKCSNNGEECMLRAEKKAKNENALPDKLNAHNYKEGFIITLDDIVMASKQASQDLVDIVKDSSGKEVKDKEDKLRDEIDNFVKIKTNKASKKLTALFDGISETETNIKNIQKNEGLYNNLCIELENLHKEIDTLKQKQSIAQTLLEKEKLTESEKEIIINENLLKNKKLFDNLRDKYALLTGEISSQKEAKEDLKKQKETLEITKKELDKLEYFDEKEIKDFNLDKDNIKLAQNIIDTEKDLNKVYDDLKSDIEDIEKNIRENNSDKALTEEQLNKLGIKNIEEYSADKNKLESNKTTYGELIDKARQNDVTNSKDDYSSVITLTFAGMFFLSLGILITHLKSDLMFFLIIMVIVSLSGTLSGIINGIKNKKIKNNMSYEVELNTLAKESITLCNKYGTTIDDTSFVSQIGKQVLVMGEKIIKYERIEEDIKQLEKVILNLENEKSEKALKLKDIEDKKEINKQKKEEFCKTTGVSIQNVEIYSDIFEKIKELRELQEKIKNDEEKIVSAEQKTEEFSQDLNKFIKEAELVDVDSVSKYDYEKFEQTLNKIKELLDTETKNQTLKESYNEQIEKLEEEIKKYPEEMVKEFNQVTEETLSELKQEFEEKTFYVGGKDKEKETLEGVTDLIDYKNKKNATINKSKEFLKTLIEKEVLYNIILAAKEKYNEIQPNLISAKEYLSKITNGKYDEIDFENKTISGKDIGEKDWDKLSRGTKEQLYLALRLGFAHNFSKDKDGNSNDLPDMPLIIDDAFVNFDKDRTRAILKCLDKISGNNQVLFFTCHTDDIKDLLDKEKIKYNAIDMGE